MHYRVTDDVRKEFRDHPRRALIITTVVYESRAVKAHLSNPETIIGAKDATYEFGRFADPAGEWLVVHAMTPQGNSDAGLVASKAHQEFGSFEAQIFVGVGGSLKDDIPIGSVVVGDYVFNGHAAKVEDTETLGRPIGLAAARELLAAARQLIYSDEWRDFIRSPHGTTLPCQAEYPCDFPPLAVIKGIVSGEEVVAGGKSPRFAWLRLHFNNCGAVEMEGWGAMKAAEYENASAIVVRGISDMCAGKDHVKDKLHQPIAAAHAAAFAFGILSFRSRVPTASRSKLEEADSPDASQAATQSPEKRVDFVFNLDGSKEEWPKDRVDALTARIRDAVKDEGLTLQRVEFGSVRLVLSMREEDARSIDLGHLREVAAENGARLLGATTLEGARDADLAKSSLISASADLLLWEKELPSGNWIDRPERREIEARFRSETSSTVLLGAPGSGKSALLSRIAGDLRNDGAAVFALKADFLAASIRTERDLQLELQLPDLPGNLILKLAELQPVYLFIDQLDALASQLDLKSERLNVLLNLIRRVGKTPNVHVLLSARSFEYNHDVRLRAIDAESVQLELPPWHEVEAQLSAIGVDPAGWPERARDVVRIPQALKTFISLAHAGRTQPFNTYQSMLEQLWLDRIGSADDCDALASLASEAAAKMADEETLWLAASRFDAQLKSLRRLEALGFLVRSENGLSVAYSHQTIFDYVLARTFVRDAGLLSSYVLERQDSLFVRAKLWSALTYLRQAEENSYEREFVRIWQTSDLRQHLRILLIEFLGQQPDPLAFEKNCLNEAISRSELRIFALKAIPGSPGWFDHFAPNAISEAMSATDLEANQALRVLTSNWKDRKNKVLQLIRERWLPLVEKDSFTWWCIQDCTQWDAELEAIARTILGRTAVSIWNVSHLAMTIATENPEAAIRLVRAKLDFLLSEARQAPEPPLYPADGSDSEQLAWHLHHDRNRELEALLDAMEWHDLSSLAAAAPRAFLETLWPWYLEIFGAILESRKRDGDDGSTYIFPGQYVLELEDSSEAGREKPLLEAVQVAIEELARNSPDDFETWCATSSKAAVLIVQQLIARGFAAQIETHASRALDWLLGDARRFQLGTVHGHRDTTTSLVRQAAPWWSKEEVGRFEEAVLAYKPSAPTHLSTPDQRRTFADIVRATKKDILHAVGVERLSPSSRELVATEQRALGDRFDRTIGRIEGGWIGSPMDAAAMGKAKDRDILKIFRDIPDKSEWNHPTRWMAGGNIQLSRAFAEFSKTDPERAIRIIDQFEPGLQERAAAYALDTMADDASNDERVIATLLDLNSRGFGSDEYRDSAARAVEKVAKRIADLDETTFEMLTSWLRASTPTEVDHTEESEVETVDSPKKEAEADGSILWGHGHSTMLPGGNFSTLSALASILLNRGEKGRDRLFAILDDHLPREANSSVWKALLIRLTNSGGSTPEVVSRFFRKLFDRYPDILASREGVHFLAYAQRWDDQLVFELIGEWASSEVDFLSQAYGELVGLVSIVKSTEPWLRAMRQIQLGSLERAKEGLAYAAANLWSEANLRVRATECLVALLSNASSSVVAAAMDLFRVNDELAPDTCTSQLLEALALPHTDLSGAPSTFVVERLQSLLPHDQAAVAAISLKLVEAWRADLGDIRTGTVTVSPQLTDIALTLHRLGGASRQAGVCLFEKMIEIDAYGSRETLAEIDGRFFPRQASARRRLARRSRPKRKSRLSEI